MTRITTLFHSPQLRWPLRLALFVLIASSITTGAAQIFLQPLVPIFYSLALTEEWIAPKIWLLVFPLLSWTIFFLNIWNLSRLRHHLEVLETMFAWITFAIILIIVIAEFRILFLVL